MIIFGENHYQIALLHSIDECAVLQTVIMRFVPLKLYKCVFMNMLGKCKTVHCNIVLETFISRER